MKNFLIWRRKTHLFSASQSENHMFFNSFYFQNSLFLMHVVIINMSAI